MEQFFMLFRQYDPRDIGLTGDKFISIVQQVFEPTQAQAHFLTIAAVDFFHELCIYNGCTSQTCTQFTSFLHEVIIILMN